MAPWYGRESLAAMMTSPLPTILPWYVTVPVTSPVAAPQPVAATMTKPKRPARERRTGSLFFINSLDSERQQFWKEQSCHESCTLVQKSIKRRDLFTAGDGRHRGNNR